MDPQIGSTPESVQLATLFKKIDQEGIDLRLIIRFERSGTDDTPTKTEIDFKFELRTIGHQLASRTSRNS